ncbi:hypothetical protein J3E68DRAFT_405202 [Trichoderma sp. SZMC 28012]
MRRAGVESQILFALFPVRYVHSSTRTKMLLVASKKQHTEKHGAICPTLALLPTCISRCAANQPSRAPFLTASTSSTCSAGQTRGLNSLCHSANLLGSWSAMPLDPCASVQRHLSTRADWQRLTRRSGPGATAQTKLVRLGRGPLVLNPSVGRRFSVPRSVAVSVGEVGVFGVVACYTAMLFFLHAVRSTSRIQNMPDLYYFTAAE